MTIAGPAELRRLAGSFNTMIDIVVRTLRRQRTFAADASHQLRNPLASLRLAVDNLGSHVEPAGRELHAIALAEAEEMGRVVDALLALTAAEGATLASTPQPLAALVAERTARWHQLAETVGMRLTVELADGLSTYAPADALGSLLDELVGNACRLSGGTALTVAAVALGPEVLLTVHDDGAGLSADERAQAAGRFWRGRDQSHLPGTGLGLAICREMVEAWGGRLTLPQFEPRGLEVRVAVPGAAEPASALPSPANSSTVEGQDLTERK